MFCGERIKIARKSHGLSQEQLGILVDRTKSCISRIEKNKDGNIESETLIRLARALHLTTDYILGLADSPIDLSITNNRKIGDKKSIGSNLRKLRKAKGLTQKEVISECGLKLSYRSRLASCEAGAGVPATIFAVALSKFYGVSTDYIFGEATDKECQ